MPSLLCTLAPLHTLPFHAACADVAAQSRATLLIRNLWGSSTCKSPSHSIYFQGAAMGGGGFNAPSSVPSASPRVAAAGRSFPGMRVREEHAHLAARVAALVAAERSMPLFSLLRVPVRRRGRQRRLPRLPSFLQPALGRASRGRFSSGRWVFKLSSSFELAAAAAAGHRPFVAAADNALQHQGHGAARV